MKLAAKVESITVNADSCNVEMRAMNADGTFTARFFMTGVDKPTAFALQPGKAYVVSFDEQTGAAQ